MPAGATTRKQAGGRRQGTKGKKRKKKALLADLVD